MIAFEIVTRILADALVVPIVLIATYALIRYIPNDQKYAAYARIAMAGLTALLIAKLLATVWQPTDVRPFIEKGLEPGAAYLDNPGFPSDHALFTAAITLAVWFETRKKGVALLLLCLTLLVGLGRVVALVHTPLDVLGGFLIAGVGALWYINLPRKLANEP